MKARFVRWLTPSLVIAGLVIALFLLAVVTGLAQLLVISALIAYILDPLAAFFESRGLSRAMATVVVFLGLMACVVTGLLLLFPRIAEEAALLQSGKYAGQAGEVVARIEHLLQTEFGFFGMENIHLMEKIQAFRVTALEKLMDFLVTEGPTLIAHLVAIPFMVFFLIKDGREMKRMLISLVPNRYFEFSLNLLFKMDMQLGNYLRGQFLDAFIFGILATIALWILNVPYFLVLGAFAGIANLIPYAGPIVGGLASVFVTVMYSSDLSRVFYVMLAFVIAKLIDDALIQPLVVAKSVDIHPLIVLLVIIIGGYFFGVLGMLLAVPATGFLKVAVQETISTARKYRFD